MLRAIVESLSCGPVCSGCSAAIQIFGSELSGRDFSNKLAEEGSGTAEVPSIHFGSGTKRARDRSCWRLEKLMISYIDMRAHAIEEEGSNLGLTWEYLKFKARELAPSVTAARCHCPLSQRKHLPLFQAEILEP